MRGIYLNFNVFKELAALCSTKRIPTEELFY